MVIRWLLTLLLFLGSGYSIAHMLDRVLFVISHDYVYPPGFIVCKSWHWIILLATLTAALTTHIRGAEHVAFTRWLQFFAGSLLATPLTALLSGVGAAAYVRYLGSNGAQHSLAPTARVAFCEWMLYGAGFGVLLGTLLFLSLIDYSSTNGSLLKIPKSPVPPRR